MTSKAGTSKKLYVGCPNLGDKQVFLGWVDKIWKSKRLSNDGPIVQEFEKQVQEFLGVNHAIAVCNATTGLQILANAVFGSYSRVYVPSFTFAATVYALDWAGFVPDFVDVELDTHNIIPIVSSPKHPIVATHLWGRPCRIDVLQNNVTPLIFDAAHAFGCSYKGVKIGNFGHGEVFSFHATKFINSFEGGMITTNNPETAEKCRLLRNFGFEGYDNSTIVGINGKMSEIHAAMGLCSLASFDRFVECNRNNYHEYVEKLYDLGGLNIVRQTGTDNTPNYQYMVLEVKRNRDKILEALWAEGIYARRYFYPGVHRMAHYKAMNISLPNTEALAEKVLVLPSGVSTTSKDITKICKIIRKEITS
jgi:dTDP-4-amino-4,6-dideoxygalactose transaminase